MTANEVLTTDQTLAVKTANALALAGEAVAGTGRSAQETVRRRTTMNKNVLPRLFANWGLAPRIRWCVLQAVVCSIEAEGNHNAWDE